MKFKSTEYAISWFRQEYMQGNLEIRPPFQRKPVWAGRQKCALIELILCGLPVPEIFMQVTTTSEGETKYAVIDGQQRVRTVLQFVGCDEDPGEEENNKFALEKLEGDSRWKNLTFEDLSPQERQSFYGYDFATRILHTSSDDEVRDMFRRLNRYLTPLNAQELRNATYSGPFMVLVTRLGDDDYWAANGIVAPAAIRRMRDVEFVSELVIGVLHGPQGGSGRILDEYYKQYEDCEDEFPEQREAEKLFAESLRIVRKTLPDIMKTRWRNRTDFYTLFVAVALLVRDGQRPGKFEALRNALVDFADKVKSRLADEQNRASSEVIAYVRAVEKGANDKKRRADRHAALLSVLKPQFKPAKGDV